VVDLVITDLAVFEIGAGGLTLIELAPGLKEAEVRARTQAPYQIALAPGAAP
jgi:3-oxoacid CoA-transferase subunit B